MAIAVSNEASTTIQPLRFTVFLSLPPNQASRGLVSRTFLLQGLDVLHDCADLVVADLAFVGRHLAFAVGNQSSQIGIRHLLHLGAAQGLQTHTLSHSRACAAIGAVAHRTLSLEYSRAVGRAKRRARQRQAGNQNQRFDFYGVALSSVRFRRRRTIPASSPDIVLQPSADQ